MDDNTHTRGLILDRAEAIYASSGLSGFSLRDITAGSDVSLAAVTHHFQTRKSLIKAMLVRALEPIAIERIALLRYVFERYATALQPAHVMLSLTLPLMRDLLSPKFPSQTAFTVRVAGDTDACVRGVMAETFGETGRHYEDAFASTGDSHRRGERLWRVALVCNMVPGNLANYSLILLCQRLLERKDYDAKMVMVALASLANTLVFGHEDTQRAQASVDALISDMDQTSAVTAFTQAMSSRSFTAT